MRSWGWAWPSQRLCVLVMAIPLFLSVYLLLSLRLDGLTSSAAPQSDGRAHIRPLVQMQQVITHLQEALSVAQVERDELLKLMHETNDSQTIHPAHLRTRDTLQQGVSSQLWPCDQLKAALSLGPRQIYNHASIQPVFLGLHSVMVVTATKVGCPQGQAPRHCLEHANYELMGQTLKLQALHDPMLMPLRALCLPLQPKEALIYAVEAGPSLNISHVLERPWNQRIQVLTSVLSFLHYLNTSPLGQLSLPQSEPQHFTVDAAGRVRFAEVWRLVVMEPMCHTSGDCRHAELGAEITCITGRCSGFNHQMSLLSFFKNFMEPLMQKSPEKLQGSVSKLLAQTPREPFDAVKLRSSLVALALWEADVGNSPGTLGPEMLPGDEAGEDAENLEWRLIGDKKLIVVPAGADEYSFERVSDMDLPAKFDYACPRSQATWGCSLRVHGLMEALSRCAGDAQCRAFTITASQSSSKGDLTIALKNSHGGLESSAGGVVYLKSLLPSADLASEEAAEAGEGLSVEAAQVSCVQELRNKQQLQHNRDERRMLQSLHIPVADEPEWQTFAAGPISGFRPLQNIEPTEVGGRVHISLAQGGPNVLFVCERGEGGHHAAHMALYGLDRLLGLFLVVPSLLRTLEVEELTTMERDAPRALVQMQGMLSEAGSLTGVIIWPLPPAVQKMPLSLPKLTNFTTRATPLGDGHRQQMEYLLLMWLSGTPGDIEHVSVLNGHVVIGLSDASFRQGVDAILPYFFHCQFPRHAMEVLLHLQAAAGNCSLAGQLMLALRQLGLSSQDQATLLANQRTSLLVNRAAEKLLTIVHSCFKIFGEDVVLYT